MTIEPWKLKQLIACSTTTNTGRIRTYRVSFLFSLFMHSARILNIDASLKSRHYFIKSPKRKTQWPITLLNEQLNHPSTHYPCTRCVVRFSNLEGDDYGGWFMPFLYFGGEIADIGHHRWYCVLLKNRLDVCGLCTFSYLFWKELSLRGMPLVTLHEKHTC